jgi:hypothetical protein
MKRADTIVVSFDKVWNEFSEAWKKARAKKSERSIHDLRVSTRRMISEAPKSQNCKAFLRSC